MTILGLLFVSAVIGGVLVVEKFADRAIGVDFSHLSHFRISLHCIIYEMAGAAVLAAILLALK